MKEGDVLLASIPQSDGQTKTRPILLLREMPPYGDLLVCGISTQLRQEVKGFDEKISRSDEDFMQSGLIADSLIRLSFLATLPKAKIIGSIGSISIYRHKRLLDSLSGYLAKRC